MQLLNTDGTVDFEALKTALQRGTHHLEHFETAFARIEALTTEVADSDLSVAVEDAKAKLLSGHRFANALVRGLGLIFVPASENQGGSVIAYSSNTGNKNDPTPPDGGQ